MGTAEVVTHGRRAVSYRVDDLRWRAARGAWRSAWQPRDETLLARDPERGRALGPLTAEHAAAARTSCAPAIEVLLARSGRRREGYAQLLGYPELRLPEDTATDPLTGARWPERHGRLIDYRHGAPGDPKLVWEVNRLQDLPLHCVAWLLSGDDEIAAFALERLVGWVERNPPDGAWGG